jgi:hypothetical protein
MKGGFFNPLGMPPAGSFSMPHIAAEGAQGYPWGVPATAQEFESLTYQGEILQQQCESLRDRRKELEKARQQEE